MTARLPCMATRDDARRAESESARDARDDAIQAIADEIGNTVEATLGAIDWTPEFLTWCWHEATKKYLAQMASVRESASIAAYEHRMEMEGYSQ